MYRTMLAIALLLTTGSQAYAPIQLVSDRGKGLVVLPQGFPGNIRGALMAPKLSVRSPASNDSPRSIPYFTARLDQTITWDDVDWCLEATGNKNGDAVRVNSCSGARAQKWNWIPDGRGHNMIQLSDTELCLHAIDKEVGPNGAPIKLRECGNEVAQWQFEESLPLPRTSQGDGIPYDARHVMIALLTLAGLGAVSLGARIWQVSATRNRKQESVCEVMALESMHPFRGAQAHASRTSNISMAEQKAFSEYAPPASVSAQTRANAQEEAGNYSATAPELDVVVKIGGSACTNKSEIETLNEVSLNAAAAQIAELAKIADHRMAVIHGAGSFGHPQAKEFGVSRGQPDGPKLLSERLREGFAKTRLSVTTLNKHVVSALVKEGLPAVGISPCPFVFTASKQLPGGSLPAVAIEGVCGLLDAGLVPVVHGDVVLDKAQACAILSGDRWMVELCRKFRARTCVFITDIDGVLTKPPSEPGAELIRDIWVDMESGELELGDVAVTQASYDVTGGLNEKLQCAAEVLMCAPSIRAVYIVRAGTESAMQALRGETPENGTSLRRRGAK